MGVLVWRLVPETKGRSLERMDEIFGTAYGDLIDVDLSDFRRGLERGKGKGVVGEGGERGVESKSLGEGLIERTVGENEGEIEMAKQIYL
jgi:hypothetical protein